ncbi:scm-like with four MBT domains protein 2 isoform X2 [Petromyzon marinus]|uniref:scm-like with four MBT domains protein 2 isoform X2 n=1 Tax=Petromyzon marinus TaxID=7757 RepID=UPI003F72C54B
MDKSSCEALGGYRFNGGLRPGRSDAFCLGSREARAMESEADTAAREASHDHPEAQTAAWAPAHASESGVCCSEEGEEEEAWFGWEEYLDEIGAVAAPHTSFLHVERSLQSSLSAGMLLEVANGGAPPATFWPAEVVMTCGPLLLLRPIGHGGDRSADFWRDILTAELHPVGWCARHQRSLVPPCAIREKHPRWEALLAEGLVDARTAPPSLLEGPNRGRPPVELIMPGERLEVREATGRELRAWPAAVVRNVGGRLRLRPCGLGPEEAALDAWLFYLHPRLHPLGWARGNRCAVEPPAAVASLRTAEQWEAARQEAYGPDAREAVPPEIFKEVAESRSHRFSQGMKLEAVHPTLPFSIAPATVTKVLSEWFFVVEMDAAGGEVAPLAPLVCSLDGPTALPAQWSLKNGVPCTPPPGYEGQDFDWAEYLKSSGAEAAPGSCFPMDEPQHGFIQGMRLEVVNPLLPSELCVATVTHLRHHLMWLRLEGLQQPQPDCIVDVRSMDIFPVGWSESNGYPLRAPRRSPPVGGARRKIAVVQPKQQVPVPFAAGETRARRELSLQPSDTGPGSGKYCCPKIFINHRCFSGPFLNKGRIAELPQSVGPGSCVLVLREVLSLLINSAYKPSRVLHELQLKGQPQWGGQEETIKAKYSGKRYRAKVELVRMAEQVADFCRSTCVRLQCCPLLFGPASTTSSCPESCHTRTKTKYTYHHGRRRCRRVVPRLASDGNDRGPKLAPRNGLKRTGTASSVDSSCAGSPQNGTHGLEGEECDEVDEEEEDEEESGSSSSAASSSWAGEEPASAVATAAATAGVLSSSSPSLAAARGAGATRKPPRSGAASRPAPQLPTLLVLERAKRKRKIRSFSSDDEQSKPRRSGGAKRPKQEKPEPAAESTRQPVTPQPQQQQQQQQPSSATAPTPAQQEFALESNPLGWSVADVVRYIKNTDCSPMARLFLEQEIDGQALLLLTLATVQECMDIKLGPAVKLCHHVERLKAAFYRQFAR